jgi:ATP-dependent exoDNAse (exonuclease V) alpha subunit
VDIKLNRHFLVKLTQFPFVPAYGITVQKCQGLTLQTAVIAPLLRNVRKHPSRCSVYVALSRVVKLENLYLMTEFTQKDQGYYRPEPLVVNEVERLYDLWQATMDACT